MTTGDGLWTLLTAAALEEEHEHYNQITIHIPEHI